MEKITIFNKFIYAFCFCVVFFTDALQAQIGQPNLGFSQACANESFNEYFTTFSFDPNNLGASNQFTIFLSDANGDFTNEISVGQGSATVSPTTIMFSLPTDTAGEGYKIRIKSSDPVGSSTSSQAFPAYYKIQDSPFSINNLVSTGNYCAGGSYILTIDNPGTGTNDSPLQYAGLTFNWFKETGPTTADFISTGQTLTVSEPGKYFAETNYGSCTSNSFSNRVEVSEAMASSVASISSSLGNPFCSGEGLTTLATISGISYQWFINGVAIPDATEQTYQTGESGIYSVMVDLGSCQVTGNIDLDGEGFISSIDVLDVNTVEIGETLMVTVTTSALDPEFQWYLNGNIISGAQENSFEVTEEGSYNVVITQNTGCVVSSEFIFEVNVPVDPFPDVENIPNLISPNGDGVNDTWIIPQDYVSGTNTEVTIMTNQGQVVLKTNDYQNNWPEDDLNLTSINQVYYYIITAPNQGTQKGSLTVVK